MFLKSDIFLCSLTESSELLLLLLLLLVVVVVVVGRLGNMNWELGGTVWGLF